MKEQIKEALAATVLGKCIVLNPFASLSPVKDPRAATLTFTDPRRRCVDVLPVACPIQARRRPISLPPGDG
jgi:hypothetical protein